MSDSSADGLGAAVTNVTPLLQGNAQHDRLKQLFRGRNYDLVGEIGRGGMGVVYLAQDMKLGRRVALKTLSPERQNRENAVRRFEREARSFAAIRHPHIATLYEFEDLGAIQFLALEYIEGTDLESERRRNRKWMPREVAEVILKVADALDHTHAKGILHRDIKPGNILIERGTNRVVLTDFGLAKGQQDETLTATGFAVGTPAYMAPEQISDHFNVKPDGRSDLFSLGTVAYEMLTGKHPFLGADDLKTMRSIVHQPVQRIRDLNPEVPEPLERIILQLIEKHPDKRPQNGRAVVELLQAFLDGKLNPAPAPPSPGNLPELAPGLTPIKPSGPLTSAPGALRPTAPQPPGPPPPPSQPTPATASPVGGAAAMSPRTPGPAIAPGAIQQPTPYSPPAPPPPPPVTMKQVIIVAVVVGAVMMGIGLVLGILLSRG